MPASLLTLAALGLPLVQGSAIGRWSDIIEFPVIPVGAIAVPEYPESTRLLFYSSNTNNTFGGSQPENTGRTQFADYNYRTGEVSHREVVNTHHDMFCPGMSSLPDNRVIITGGSNAYAVTIYDPSTNSFIEGTPMNIARGYQTQTTLSNGKIFVLGGSWGVGRALTPPILHGVSDDDIGDKHGELYDPETDTWTIIAGASADAILTNDTQGEFTADNHAWLFPWTNGTVFHAGPSRNMNWFDTAGEGSFQPAGVRESEFDAMNGVHVMYDIGRIFAAGGGPDYNNGPAISHAFLIDINEANQDPYVERLPDLAYARTFANAAVLPNGQILVTGGQSWAESFTDFNATNTPELYDPVTKNFTLMAPHSQARTYHSVSILLSNARVLIGGGGLCGAPINGTDFCQFTGRTGPEMDHPNAEIFSPPYLFNEDGTDAVRPVIESLSTTQVLPGETLDVTIEGEGGLEGFTFALLRMGTVTHSVNSDQRRIPLVPESINGQTATLRLPNDAGIVLPGPWFLFASSPEGVPSIAKTVAVLL